MTTPLDAALEPLAPAVAQTPVQQSTRVPAFRVIDSKMGHAIDIRPRDGELFDIEPLGFDELEDAVSNKNDAFPIKIRNALAPVEQTGLSSDAVEVSTTLQIPSDIGVYGIVPGGWVPVPMSGRRIALVDRNIVLRLEKLGSQLASSSPDWAYRHFGLDVQSVSPLLCALEGRHGRTPTDREMRDELTRASRVLQALLPYARVQTVGTQHRKALRKLMFEHEVLLQRRRRFLLEIAPRLAHTASAATRRKLEDDVVASAISHSLRPADLCVLAAISCVYDSVSQASAGEVYRPGRAVIKPKPAGKYTEKLAHNAVADIFALEVLVNSNALVENGEAALYTEDVGLVAFWVALAPGAMTAEYTGPATGRVRINLQVTPALVPSLDEAGRIALAERLRNASK